MHTIEDVVSGGMCVGCGACSVATSGAIPVTIGTRQSFEASLANVSEADLRRGSRVCPFSDESKNENELSERALPEATLHDERLGKFTSILAGRVHSAEYIPGSSSGGMTSWVAAQLLDRGHVDGVIHVGPEEGGPQLFGYQVSYRTADVEAKRKSTYYASTFADAIASIRGDGKRYAFIGVPCFVRAARALCDGDEALASQLVYFLGLVCGHLKSFGFAESLAWQVGVRPDELDSVDFRVKVPGKSSGHYDFGARAKGASELLTQPTASLVGGNWGHGMFQLNACNYCDDIFAETADVAFGDAWLPQYKEDWRGTNVVVIRNETIGGILREGALSGELDLETLTPDDAARSQAGNFRHRRDGLSVRLEDDIAAGKSVPVKRVAPGSRTVTPARRRIIRQRRKLSDLSESIFLEAKKRGSLGYFLDGVSPLVREYKRAEATGRAPSGRILKRVKSILSGLASRISR